MKTIIYLLLVFIVGCMFVFFLTIIKKDNQIKTLTSINDSLNIQLKQANDSELIMIIYKKGWINGVNTISKAYCEIGYINPEIGINLFKKDSLALVGLLNHNKRKPLKGFYIGIDGKPYKSK
jgi:hypothetical protein